MSTLQNLPLAILFALLLHCPRADSGEEADARQIAALINQLGHRSFVKREAASRKLESIGLAALDQLVEAASANTDAEVRVRATALVEKFKVSTRDHALTVMKKHGGIFEVVDRPAAQPELYSLALSRTMVTDADLAWMRWLSELRHLDLGHTRITDRGLAHLKHLKLMQMLQLHDTGVTDAALSDLAALGNLEWLDLSNTAVTDKGLKKLHQHERLKGLILNGTKITPQGIADFKKARPGVSIIEP